MKWLFRAVGALVVMILVAVTALWAISSREGAGTMSASITIQRPASEVYPWLLEPAKLKSWVGWLVEVREPNGPVRGGGGKQVWVMEDRNNNNALMEIVETIETYQPPAVLRIRTEALEGFHGVHEYRLVDVPGGATRLESVASYDFDKWVYKLLSPLIMGEATRKFQDDLARLKTKVEAQPHS